MPDKRTHRGPHPADAKLFAADALSDLRSAVADYSLLLTKGYAEKGALKLVGDKFSLTQRQRLAVMRSACSDGQLASRNRRCIVPENLAGRAIAIDGYNVLITVEAAMSGGVIFKGRDSCFKDLASIHGTYRKVTETIPAVELIGDFLGEVSLIGELARKNNWNWEIELLLSPDAELKKTDYVVASSDSVVLDGCRSWVNLATEIIKNKLPSAKVIDLSGT